MSLAIGRLLYIVIGQVVHSRLIKMSSSLAQARDVIKWSVFWLARFLESIDTNALMLFKIKRGSIQKGGNIKLVWYIIWEELLSTAILANTRRTGFSGKLGFGVLSIYNSTYRLCMLIFSDLYFSSLLWIWMEHNQWYYQGFKDWTQKKRSSHL